MPDTVKRTMSSLRSKRKQLRELQEQIRKDEERLSKQLGGRRLKLGKEIADSIPDDFVASLSASDMKAFGKIISSLIDLADPQHDGIMVPYPSRVDQSRARQLFGLEPMSEDSEDATELSIQMGTDDGEDDALPSTAEDDVPDDGSTSEAIPNATDDEGRYANETVVIGAGGASSYDGSGIYGAAV